MRLALLLVALLCTGCQLADLRPAHLEGRTPTEHEQARGRELLAQAVDAQGGAAAWSEWAAPVVTFRDEWQGLIGRFSCPWPALENHVRLQWRRDGAATDARFLDGPEVARTWHLGPDSADDDLGESQQFILRTYPYLMELPFRLLEAPKVAWIGEREHDGRMFDLVLATWVSFEPSPDYDQFVLWLDRESRRLVLAHYTIRDKYKWATGADHFEDFRPVGALTLPHRHTIGLEPWSDSFVHRIEIESAR